MGERRIDYLSLLGCYKTGGQKYDVAKSKLYIPTPERISATIFIQFMDILEVSSSTSSTKSAKDTKLGRIIKRESG